MQQATKRMVLSTLTLWQSNDKFLRTTLITTS